MKVALLTAQPNTDKKVGGFEFNVSEKRPPHGLGYILAVLRKAGHQVEIYDRYCGDLTLPGNRFEDVDLLGIYCTTVCMDDVKSLLGWNRAPKVAVGGPHWSIFPEDGQGEDWRNQIDFIVQGEGEHSITRILDYPVPNYRTVKTITPARLTDADLDRLPRFPWDYFWNNHHNIYHWVSPFTQAQPIFTMNTSRGCPYSCSFCNTKKVWGRKITFMPARRIFDDIQYLRYSFGCQGIYFREDNFTLDNHRVRALCELLLIHGVKVQWACETRVDTVDRELMGVMARAGCTGFYVGVEHGSQKILDILNKGITVEQIETFFHNARELGIGTAASMIIDHPDETEDDKAAFWALVEKIRPTMLWRNYYRKDG